MSPIQRFSVGDVQDPKRLTALITSLARELEATQAKLAALERTASIPQLGVGEFAQIRSALQSNGPVPLNVSLLPGILAQSQRGFAVVASTAATLPDPTLYEVGTLGAVLAGSVLTLYIVAEGTPRSWVAQTTLTLTVVDSTFTIQDDGDSTKKIRFEASLITTATTRVMTTPDTNQILAGRDVNNSFTVSQDVINALDANLILTVQDTNATGTAAAGVIRARGDTSNLSMIGHGTGRVVTRCGITMGGWNELFGVAGSGLLIDITGAFPIVFGTNSLERLRIDSAGLATFITPSKCILIKPSSAPAASTLMAEIQTNAGASVWSVDIEGDQINRTLKLIGAVADTLLIQPASASGGAKLFVIKTTAAVEAIAMRDTGQVNLTGTAAAILADSSTSGAVVFEVKLSGSQKAAIDSDGWIAGTALTTGSGGTKITKIVAYSPSLTPAAVAALTTAEQTFTVTGLTTADRVTFPNKPTAQAGLGIVGARVSAADTLAITFSNNTAGSITPTAAEAYKFLAFRS